MQDSKDEKMFRSPVLDGGLCYYIRYGGATVKSKPQPRVEDARSWK